MFNRHQNMMGKTSNSDIIDFLPRDFRGVGMFPWQQIYAS